MSQIFTVFGATGKQGGSVVRAVLADPVLSKKFKVRGITRDASKPAAKALADQGVEVVEADMSSVDAAAPAVNGAHTVFLVTNFWETASADTEFAQGKAVTDAAKAAGVKHIIASTLINVTEASKGRLTGVTHFDSKAKIEQYIRQSGIPATFFMPGFYMENFLGMIKKNEDGAYALTLPVSGDKAKIPIFDTASDTGLFVKAALKEESPSGKRILAATDYVTPNTVVAEFSEVLGKPANFNSPSAEVFKSFLPASQAQELLENMLLLEDPGYYAGADLTESHGLLDAKPTTWKAFVEAHKQKWL
ncbi:hypothetical protein LLEC1_06921 [Akanthomyces lecanii]|uniref:NmrA-like domain-containing protein n=1 Tax=Cordyceps confragosa TaxID=2714763 RepID=A0A179IV51_CORDF|nr:hypothetical protein LLEC1_06921 [Akanthomyces lecanii]